MSLSIPRIEISQQYAQLGLDADLGKQELQQPRPKVDMKQKPADLKISNPLGHFEINQDRAWDALALGNITKTMSRIYSQAPQIALEGIKRIVEDGNRMAAIHKPGNAIAELAADWREGAPPVQMVGEASYLNVDMEYVRGNLSIDAQRRGVELNVQVNRPIHEYTRGKLDIYMLQYGKVEITPPQIDVTL